MQPLTGEVDNVGALILVRSAADVPLAIHGVSELLWRRHARGASGHHVLGVVAGAGIDPDSCMQPFVGGGKITLRESIGLSGIWNLCWFDLGPLERAQLEAERRHRLFDCLRPDLQGTLFPVFTCKEAREGTDQLVEDLALRSSALSMGQHCFVHDPVRSGRFRLHVRQTSLQLH